MLRVEGLCVAYDRTPALHDVHLEVPTGEIVALVGANGAGKSTLLRAISGVVPVERGSVYLDGTCIDGWPPHRRVAAGIAHVPEGRRVFADLTVEENLRLGAFAHPGYQVDRRVQEMLELFPELSARRQQLAGQLSGGEQQMLAIARGLMSSPRLLMLDEPLMGLAPVVVQRVLDLIVHIRERGTTVLVAEQNVHLALGIADRAYVLETGRIVLGGNSRDMSESPAVREAYLGMA